MTIFIAFLIVFVAPCVAMVTLFASSGAGRLEGGTWLKHGYQNRYRRDPFAPIG